MKKYTISLFGHKNIYESKTIEEKLYSLLGNIALSEPIVEIYIGRNGEFDILVASFVKRVKKGEHTPH